MSGTLVSEWAAGGHDVTVLTTSAGAEDASNPVRVIRRPSLPALVRAIQACDLYFQSNISLRTLWPALLMRKPVVVTYHTWVSGVNGRRRWQDYLKLFASRFIAKNLAVSRELAESISPRCEVIPNPYQDEVFRPVGGIVRDRELVFVGRLVSDKGLDIALDALTLLASRHSRPDLTVIGSGPAENTLRARVAELRLQEQVTFLGALPPAQVAEQLNRHQILIVPSRWREPFGLVALEGIACGCVVLGSTGGGLPDAIGPCGLTFPNGEPRAMADRLEYLLGNSDRLAYLRSHAPAHLETHRGRAVAARYLEIFEKVLNRRERK